MKAKTVLSLCLTLFAGVLTCQCSGANTGGGEEQDVGYKDPRWRLARLFNLKC